MRKQKSNYISQDKGNS